MRELFFDMDYWTPFCMRHRGNPFLQQDPLYALSRKVIESIKANVPDFFSQEQEEFERDLAETSPFGFSGGDPIGLTLSMPSPPIYLPEDATKDDGTDLPLNRQPDYYNHPPEFVAKLGKQKGMTVGHFVRTVSKPPKWVRDLSERLIPPLDDFHIHELLRGSKELRATIQGRDASDLEATREAERQERIQIEKRREAYAGWLVLNPIFRKESRALRTHFENSISLEGPHLPLCSPLRWVSSGETQDDDPWAPYRQFARRWCLECMWTWELPSPLGPLFSVDGFSGNLGGYEQGVTICLPWSLLSGSQPNIHKIVQRLARESAPDHMREWLNASGLGEQSYQRLFWLYHCLELVLLRRYPSQCQRRLTKLDEALGQVMDRGADVVKDLRERLARGLKT